MLLRWTMFEATLRPWAAPDAKSRMAQWWWLPCLVYTGLQRGAGVIKSEVGWSNDAMHMFHRYRAVVSGVRVPFAPEEGMRDAACHGGAMRGIWVRAQTRPRSPQPEPGPNGTIMS